MPCGTTCLTLLALALSCSALEDGPDPSCPAGDSSCNSGRLPVRVFTVEELALYNGSDPDKPVFLAVLGEVFDVSAGKRFYGKGGGYAGLAGRDGSRAFSTGAFENNGTASDIFDLDDEDIAEVLGWWSFYKGHAEYTFQGVLADRYYDSQGNPTEAHRRAQAMSQDADKVGALKAELRKRFMSCNTRHEAANSYVDIWCDDGYHGKGAKPLHVYWEIPASGTRKAEAGDWCACLTKKMRKAAEAEAAEQLQKPRHGMPTFRLADYAECRKKQRCQRPKGAKPP